MKTVFVTVSDDRSGRKGGRYGETQNMILKFLENNNLGIDDKIMWDFKDIKQTKFYDECIVKGGELEEDMLHPISKELILPKGHKIEDKRLLDFIDPAYNGRVYKPLAINESFEKLDEGDYLIYNDCSPELWEYFLKEEKLDNNEFDLDVIRDLCDKNGGILTSHVRWNHLDHVVNGVPGCHTHENFTTERCMNEMGMEKYKHSLQHASGMIVIKKNKISDKFIKDWLYWNSKPYCGGLGPEWDILFWFNEVINHGKIGHRHDQSISGLLINSINNKLVQTLDYYERPYGSNPYNFLFFCKKKYKYTFLESNQPPTKEVYRNNYKSEIVKSYRY